MDNISGARISQKKNKKYQLSVKKHEHERLKENYRLDLSDSEFEFTSSVLTSKRKLRVKESRESVTKKSKDEMFPESFSCFEDTQALLSKVKTVENANFENTLLGEIKTDANTNFENTLFGQIKTDANTNFENTLFSQVKTDANTNGEESKELGGFRESKEKGGNVDYANTNFESTQSLLSRIKTGANTNFENTLFGQIKTDANTNFQNTLFSQVKTDANTNGEKSKELGGFRESKEKGGNVDYANTNFESTLSLVSRIKTDANTNFEDTLFSEIKTDANTHFENTLSGKIKTNANTNFENTLFGKIKSDANTHFENTLFSRIKTDANTNFQESKDFREGEAINYTFDDDFFLPITQELLEDKKSEGRKCTLDLDERALKELEINPRFGNRREDYEDILSKVKIVIGSGKKVACCSNKDSKYEPAFSQTYIDYSQLIKDVDKAIDTNQKETQKYDLQIIADGKKEGNVNPHVPGNLEKSESLGEPKIQHNLNVRKSELDSTSDRKTQNVRELDETIAAFIDANTKKNLNTSTPVKRKISLSNNQENNDVHFEETKQHSQALVNQTNQEPCSSTTQTGRRPKISLTQLMSQNSQMLDLKLSQLFKSTQYRREMNLQFDRVEESIYEFGVNQDESISKPQRKCDAIGRLLERTLKSPEVIKKVLESAEESIKSAGEDNPWSDDSLLANAVINMSVEGSRSIGSLIKKALLENVRKNISPEKLVNATIREDDNVFRSYGRFYGLPDRVKDLIKQYKGIEKLYEWQDECLNLPAVKARKNLVYALPTSGGKTLVAEILILREILCRRKNVIFVLPYVAIVQEKVWGLSSFAVALEFLIEEYAGGKGNYPPRKRRRRNSVYIATIEKALGLMNSLIELNRTDEIGLIVVDELHLVGDRSRGSTLEEFLTKVKYLKDKIQVVGMSATIGNLKEICDFLDADVYSRDFRPVELVEYVKCGQEIARVDWNAPSEDDILIFERKVHYQYTDAIKKLDPDQLGGLVMEVIPKSSCLIFCRSKQNCENVALLLCKIIPSNIKKHRAAEKEVIRKALKDEAGALCKVLRVSIAFGIAYHHSGLTSEERRVIEEGFRQGVISVICCTSTLAAGVNLPAQRVIIRNPYIGRDFINLSRYKQMVGRAGRAGFGEKGESIVICTPQELPRVRDLFKSPMDVALSGMHENDHRGLQQFILSCISLKMACSKTEIEMIISTTLLSIQKEKLDVNVKKSTRAVIKNLFKKGALQVEGQQNPVDNGVSITLDTTIDSVCLNSSKSPMKTLVTVTNDTRLEISKMGRAAIKGGLDLSRAHMLYEDLLQAQYSLVLFTGLHLMYLVTPYDISEQITPTKSHYYTLYSQLTSRELQTANVLGLTEAVAAKMLNNKRITEVPERVLNRFYITLMLYDLWDETPLYEVAAKYEVNRGLIQNLMTAAATFASNVYHFCEELEEFWAFSLLLKGMSDRLSHCCVKELVPLMNLPSVKQNRAKQLFKAGYKTLQSIAKANPDDLVQNIEYMSRKLANQLIAAAKLFLLEKVENLREEAEDVLDGVDI